MKILLSNNTAHPHIGGVENSLRYMAQELIKKGHEVKIFCFQFSPDEPLCIEHECVEITRYPCSCERWPHRQQLCRVEAAKIGVVAVLEEFKPDIVWSRSAPVGLGIRLAGFNGPLLQIFPTNAYMNCRGSFLQTHGLPLNRRIMMAGLWPFAYFSSAYIERKLSRLCTPITFSQNMRQQLLKAFPKDANLSHVIPPGIDLNKFSPEAGQHFFSSIKQKFGLDTTKPAVLYVGRLSCAKNIPLLMDAVKLLKNSVQLVLVGSGPEERRLQEYAIQIGIADRVIFAGMQSEMLAGFYAISRVCVLATTIESFGQVFLESLACGTPVVGFSGDGKKVLTATNEIVKDGLTGAIAYKVNASALSSKIEKILALDSNSYAEMSRCARKDVSERFSWGKFVDKALELSVK